jgi:aryl-alcohol dehydrogenase-like predicted oxidoreductase
VTDPAPSTLTIGGELTVDRLGFGAMRITGAGTWGEPPDREAARALLRRVLELGVQLLDTADAYGPEVSERLIAETLYPYPQGVLVATKSGHVRPGPDVWKSDCRPEHLRAACERSLRLLRIERIDLYYLHAGEDPDTPFEESVGALAALRAEGKIRHVGLSKVTPEQLAAAQAIVPVVAVQNRYHLANRADEAMLELCEREGIAYVAFHPLGAGALARADSPLAPFAAARGITPAQAALAWLLHRSPAVVPIPGTSSREHLEENVGAAGVKLDAEELDALARAGCCTVGR